MNAVEQELTHYLAANPLESIYDPADDQGSGEDVCTILREVIFAVKQNESEFVFIEYDSRMKRAFDRFKMALWVGAENECEFVKKRIPIFIGKMSQK